MPHWVFSITWGGGIVLLCLTTLIHHGMAACMVSAVGAICILFLPQLGTTMKIGKFLGKISYSMYCVHYVVGVSLVRLGMRMFDVEVVWIRIGIVSFAAVVCLGLAFVIYRFVELPSHQASRKMR